MTRLLFQARCYCEERCEDVAVGRGLSPTRRGDEIHSESKTTWTDQVSKAQNQNRLTRGLESWMEHTRMEILYGCRCMSHGDY